LRDPIRNLVYYAQPADLADVLVDGRPIVEDGVVLGADVGSATRRVQEAGQRVWSRWPLGDWAGRTLDEVAPPTYAEFVEP
jgi:5-methylthioadenosine/S-adenosylhomocysteine deaminase